MANSDPRIGRRITWNLYGIQFEGTVTGVYQDFDETEMLAVKIEKNGQGTACVFPPENNPRPVPSQWLS